MSLFLSLAIGYLISDLYLDPHRRNTWLAVFAAPGLGFAFSSAVLLVNLLFQGALNFKLCLAAHLMALIFLLITEFKRQRGARTFENKAVYMLVLLLAVLFMSAVFFKSPYGTGLDVWAIWKLKARHLFYGQEPFISLKAAPLNFSHPDYPLFYPLSLAWGWMWSGGQNVWVSWFFCAVFATGLAGAVAWGCGQKGWMLFAGLFVISTPQIMGMAGSQYADIFVAYFNCLAIAIFLRGEENFETYFWTGIFFGIGTFVKNEGWLSLAAMAFILVPSKSRNMGAFLAGALPGVILCLLFKWKIAAHQTTAIHFEGFQGITTYLQFLVREVLNENKWTYGWIGILLLPVLMKPKERKIQTVYLWFLVVNAGYALVHLTDGCSGPALENHLSTTFDRLLTHTFPAASVVTFAFLSQMNRNMPAKIIGGPMSSAKR